MSDTPELAASRVGDAKISAVTMRSFRTVAKTAVDPAGHRHPSEPHEEIDRVLEIRDTDGFVGRVRVRGDHLRPGILGGIIRPIVVGANPWDREQIWLAIARKQRGALGSLSDRALGYVDQALWDLIGKRAGLPVWRLLGGARSSVPAYASTMCGDEIPGGLSSPEDYASFAEALVARGYQAIKLHTWMAPVRNAPSVRLDLAACAAVREAVGPDYTLMLDGSHWYSRMEALELGRGIEKLSYYWFEEPMEEASVSSYAWLARELSIPVIGPETSWGKHMARAEWIAAGACDILRSGVDDVGGISPTVKSMHLAESFGMECEIHGNGSGNLAVLGAGLNGRWYERGLLHPHFDFDEPQPHYRSIVDAVDSTGQVALPERPGLGDDWDVEYVEERTVETW